MRVFVSNFCELVGNRVDTTSAVRLHDKRELPDAFGGRGFGHKRRGRRQLAGARLSFFLSLYDTEERAGGGGVIESRDTHGLGGADAFDALAAEVLDKAYRSVRIAGDDEAVLSKRAVLHDKRRRGATLRVLGRLQHESFGRSVRLGRQFGGVGSEKDEIQEFRDPFATL